MIEMLKRHEIQVLRRAGHTWKEVAALSGVSVRTVRRIAAETAITTKQAVPQYLHFLRSPAAKAIFEKYGFSFLIRPVS